MILPLDWPAKRSRQAVVQGAAPLAVARRLMSTGTVLALSTVRLLVGVAMERVRHDRNPHRVLGAVLASAFETLGGGYLKFGQVLSSRADLLHPDVLRYLAQLQDEVRPAAFREVRQTIEASFSKPLESVFTSFDEAPVAAASVAQVHVATLQSHGTVAVKVRRRGIATILNVDAAVLNSIARMLAVLPPLRRLPVVQAVEQVATAMIQQSDFELERAYHVRLHQVFSDRADIVVPSLVPEYCTGDVLVMEYIPRVTKISEPSLSYPVHRTAVTIGLKALYEMIFVAGVIHCDLHPGNVLVDDRGRLILVDFGFCARLTEAERTAFARFFLSIRVDDGPTAARIMLETALRVPATLRREDFVREITGLIHRYAGVAASEFLIASFVFALFSVLYSHEIVGSPSFTMAILSLVVYEGVIRQRCADIDFQTEAVPAIVRALWKN